eukprot:233158_1
MGCGHSNEPSFDPIPGSLDDGNVSFALLINRQQVLSGRILQDLQDPFLSEINQIYKKYMTMSEQSSTNTAKQPSSHQQKDADSVSNKAYECTEATDSASQRPNPSSNPHSNTKLINPTVPTPTADNSELKLLFGHIFRTGNCMSNSKRLYGCSFVSHATIDLYSIRTTAMGGSPGCARRFKDKKLILREWINDTETFNDGNHALSGKIIAESCNWSDLEFDSDATYPLLEFNFNVTLQKDQKYVIQFDGDMYCKIIHSRLQQESDTIPCRAYDIDGINRNYLRYCPFEICYVGSGLSLEIDKMKAIILHWYKSKLLAVDIITMITQFYPQDAIPRWFNVKTGSIEDKRRYFSKLYEPKPPKKTNSISPIKKAPLPSDSQIKLLFGHIFRTSNCMSNEDRLFGCSFTSPGDVDLYSVKSSAMGGAPNCADRVKKGSVALRQWINDFETFDDDYDGIHALSGAIIAESHSVSILKDETSAYPLAEYVFWTGDETKISLEKNRKYMIQFEPVQTSMYCVMIHSRLKTDDKITCRAYDIEGINANYLRYCPFEIYYVHRKDQESVTPQKMNLKTGYIENI